MRQIVLLRGINVGSRNRIAMASLREVLEADGFAEVQTHLQSGNVVLGSELAPERLAARCEALIESAFQLQIGVVVRSRDELAAVIARDPLGEIASDPKRYLVSFLADQIDGVQLARLAELAVAPERLSAHGRELYSWHPGGVARSKLWNALASRRLGVTITTRNWATATRLLALADG